MRAIYLSTEDINSIMVILHREAQQSGPLSYATKLYSRFVAAVGASRTER